MAGKQQILYSIINEGHQLLKEGDLENPSAFKNKLTMLEDQWQSFSQRANQKKALIDLTLNQWQNFNALDEKLVTKLTECDESLEMIDFEKAPLIRFKSALDSVKVFI